MSTPSKEVILIIGMGRSGTSALTRVLSLCGCTLPGSVLGAMEINRRGSWEPVDIWKLNGEFMLRHGTTAGNPAILLQELIFDEPEKENYIGQVQEFMTTWFRGPPLVIKQPAITDFMELWVEAARRGGFTIKVAISIRHPREVFASLAAMAGSSTPMSLELANALWLKRNLLAERSSRDFSRVFVGYPNLMKDWRAEVARVSKVLSIDTQPDEAAIDNFITGDLHRQRHSGPVTETFGYSWLARVYATLSAAAQDESVDLQTMDEIYDAYRANERAFRIARDEFLDSFNRINPQQYREMLNNAPVWVGGRDFD